MRVLYLNHTGQVSGAERTLLDFLAARPVDLEPLVACPDGPLTAELEALGIERWRVRGTSASLRIDLRDTGAALLDVARTVRAFSGVVRAGRPDLIHANSIRAGVIAGLTPGSIPALITHVHDRLPRGVVASAALVAGTWRSARVFACSNYAGTAVRSRQKLCVVHNPVDVERFGPGVLPRALARTRLGIPEQAPVLGVVAQITPWKGQDDAVRVLALLRREHPELRLVLVGSPKFTSGATRYDNIDYDRRLRHMIHELALDERVLLLGERSDVAEILSALDVLLVPSWEEPFGRSMIEAMAVGLPVVATSVGGPREVIRDGHSGFLVAPKSPDGWSRRVAELLADDELRTRVGQAARERVVSAFSTTSYVERVLAGYREALAAGVSARA